MNSETPAGERYYTWRKAPPFIRPPHPIPGRNMKVLGLVGVAVLLSGYDLQIFGLVAKQLLAEFGRGPEETGPTIALFRIGVFGALGLCLLADIIGRRRLLLITIAGLIVSTLATAFAPNYESAVVAQLLARIFGYTEDMLCIVVIAEEFEERSRGWAIGSLGALGALGAGLAFLVFAAVEILPYGWRGVYFIGAVPLLLIAWLRRGLPETRRFQALRDSGVARRSVGGMWRPIATLLRVYPLRVTILFLSVLIYYFGTAPAIALLPTYLQADRGFAPWMVTASIVGTGLFGLLVSIAVGRLSDRVGRRPTLAVGIAVAGIGFATIYAGGPAWMAVMGILFGVFAQVAVGVQVDAVGAELFPTAYRATASAVRQIGSIVGGAVALLLHGTALTPEFGFGGAVLVLLIPLPFAIFGMLLLPETAGKVLEDIAPEPA